MIQLHKLVFNSFQVNTYILQDETGECVIIDPANYSEEENMALSRFISEHQLTPVKHLNTHCHIDHVLGMHYVRDRYKIQSYAHEADNILLERGPLMGEIFGFKVAPLPLPDHYLGDQEYISFGNSEIRALHVPGHSAGSLSYYAEKEGFVISGDALFEGSIGRTDLPGGDYDTLIESISSKLFTLPPQTKVWPGHGAFTTVEDEIAHNPFFNDYKT